MVNKKKSPLNLSVIGFGIAINIVGAFIALNLRLPIYLDSMGTIMVSFLMGPVAGVITGILGSITAGITFDIYSLYFAPVQIFTGLIAGILFRKNFMHGYKMFIGVFILTIFVSFSSAVVAALVFGGITSSGSSYIVAVLSNLGVNKVLAVFMVQFFTDYTDKFIACALMSVVYYRVPTTIKEKLN